MSKFEINKKSKVRKALLIGDLMLDKYVFGKVTRISPEAPVPVFLSRQKQQVLGGAGNVFNNLSSLGAEVTLISVIGKDSAGKAVKELIKNRKLHKCYLFQDRERLTTIKTRYLSNNQQLIRVDEESRKNISKLAEGFILSNFKKSISATNVVVISDYNKGLVTKSLMQKILQISRKHKVPVIVDPKNKDFDIYRGCYLITPNQLEASNISGFDCNSDKEAEKCAKFIMGKYNIENVLITRGEKGLTYLNKKKVIHSPTKKIEVYDVSGAGDTVLAILTISIFSNMSVEDILHYANKAAGIVVGKIGTSVIKKSEMLDKESIEEDKKIFNLSQLKKKVLNDKEEGLRIGFTNGCFDVIHYGHISYLEESKKLCDKLIVAINSDTSIKKLKGSSRPINNQLFRSKVLASLRCCDYVIIFDNDTPLNLIKSLKPNLLTKGGDYKKKEVVGSKELLKWGGETKILGYVNKLSTTNIINSK